MPVDGEVKILSIDELKTADVVTAAPVAGTPGLVVYSATGGGGGGPVSIADGADVAEGSTTDPAWDGVAAAATVISILKRLAGAAGGSAVTIADGADVNQGATTDPAVLTDVNATMSAKLRGILLTLVDSLSSLLSIETHTAETRDAVLGLMGVDAKTLTDLNNALASIDNNTSDISGAVQAIEANTDNFNSAGGGGYIRQDSTATIAKETGGNLAAIKTNTDGILLDTTNIDANTGTTAAVLSGVQVDLGGGVHALAVVGPEGIPVATSLGRSTVTTISWGVGTGSGTTQTLDVAAYDSVAMRVTYPATLGGSVFIFIEGTVDGTSWVGIPLIQSPGASAFGDQAIVAAFLVGGTLYGPRLLFANIAGLSKIRLRTSGTFTGSGNFVVEMAAQAGNGYTPQFNQVRGELQHNATTGSTAAALPVLPGLANAVAPVLTEGRAVLLSLDLAGNLRVLDSAGNALITASNVLLTAGNASLTDIDAQLVSLVAGLLRTQGAASPTVTGPMIQGVVSDGERSFVTDTVRPVSLTPEGRTRVSAILEEEPTFFRGAEPYFSSPDLTNANSPWSIGSRSPWGA